MPQLWEVVGGDGGGGLLVRAGRSLSSAEKAERLSTYALVEEELLIGQRLLYKKRAGAGPDTGWVSLTVKGKPLLVKTEKKVAVSTAMPGYDGSGGSTPTAASLSGSQVVLKADAWKESTVTSLTSTSAGASEPNPVDHLATLKNALAGLEKPVQAVLRGRSELERVAGTDPAPLQERLQVQELHLVTALGAVRAAAEAVDPPKRTVQRSGLRCATAGCCFAVNWREEMGGFCCIVCARGDGKHGPRCERATPAVAPQTADGSLKPISAEHLADIELDEAVRLSKLGVTAPSMPVVTTGAAQTETWLASDPEWSRSGREAIGQWVSSIIDDEWGNPDNQGPAQMLSGGLWTSASTKTTDQWINLDLGKVMLVSEVRVRGHYVQTLFNAKRIQLQSGTSLSGSWTTVLTFVAARDGGWTVAAVEPPIASRWWRMRIATNWGGREYVWLHGLGLRLQDMKASKANSRTDDVDDTTSDGGVVKTDVDSKGTTCSAGDVSEDPHASGKYANSTLTHEDLRKDDADWQQLTGYTKLLYYTQIEDRILFLTDMPYIDYRWHSVVEYRDRFLAQPQNCGWSLDFNPDFFCELAYEGFSPMGLEILFGGDLKVQILSPSFDTEQHVWDCLETHVSRKVRKRAGRYSLTIDAAYDEVLLGCLQQHGEAWLYRGIRWVLRKLRAEGYTGNKNIDFAIRSFELWDANGKLVAGDLGYSVGKVYVSMTGFHERHTRGAGEVQLVLTAALLHKLGLKWFNLGQVKTYKARLGAKELGREAFLKRWCPDRDRRGVFSHERIGGAELLNHLLGAIAAEKGRLDQPPQVKL